MPHVKAIFAYTGTKWYQLAMGKGVPKYAYYWLLLTVSSELVLSMIYVVSCDLLMWAAFKISRENMLIYGSKINMHNC